MANKYSHFHAYVNTPLGKLCLISNNEALLQVMWEEQWKDQGCKDIDSSQRPKVLELAVREVNAYFQNKLKKFSTPLDPSGTVFQRQVWGILQTTIPYGQVMTYSEQARCLGSVDKRRAVGLANGRNPLPIFIPCHRVIGKSGKLVGFSGRLERKAWLLDWEGVELSSAKEYAKLRDDQMLHHENAR